MYYFEISDLVPSFLYSKAVECSNKTMMDDKKSYHQTITTTYKRTPFKNWVMSRRFWHSSKLKAVLLVNSYSINEVDQEYENSKVYCFSRNHEKYEFVNANNIKAGFEATYGVYIDLVKVTGHFDVEKIDKEKEILDLANSLT